MAVKEIRQRVVTCDRCKLEVIQPIDALELPAGWGHVVLEIVEGLAVTKADLCPLHMAAIEEAIRPLERVRRKGEA